MKVIYEGTISTYTKICKKLWMQVTDNRMCYIRSCTHILDIYTHTLCTKTHLISFFVQSEHEYPQNILMSRSHGALY